jgi:hypothetical protein
MRSPNEAQNLAHCRHRPIPYLVACTWVGLAVLQGCAASIVPPETGTTVAPAASTTVPANASAATGDNAPADTADEGGPIGTLKALLPKGQQIIGTPTELYTRIARGALTCWFGASGPLKSGYIYHAEAAPPSKGGRSEIVIRVRDKAAADQRSLRAFRVVIAPGESGSVIEIENVTIAEPLASSLTSDVRRWAAEEEGCSAVPATATWTADREAAKPAAADKAAKTKPREKKTTKAKKN